MLLALPMPFPFETARHEALRKLVKERFGEITAAEDEVLRRSASAEDDDPKESNQKSEIKAEFLRWLATEKDAAPHIDPLGIRVANAVIREVLVLDSCVLPFAMSFDFCTFGKGMRFRRAEVPSLSLFHCTSNASIEADGLVTRDRVLLRGVQANGEVRLLGAQIGSDLDCGGTTLTATGDALSFHTAKIRGNVFLNHGFSSTGEIGFIGAEIGDSFDCGGATLTATEAALTGDRARISGSVFLTDGFSSTGEIRFLGAQIGGGFECIGADLTASEKALSADGVTISGDVFLSRGFSSSGEIRFLGAHIGGNFDCSGATLTATGLCLNLENLKVTGSAFLRDGYSSAGTLVFFGAQIGGNLNFNGATLMADEALDLTNARVTGDVDLNHGFSSTGIIRLDGAQINGNLDFGGATLASTGVALQAARVNVGGGVFLKYGFSSPGAIVFQGAVIGGSLECVGAGITELNCEKARIAGDMIFAGIRKPNLADLKLTGATVNTLHDERASWPHYGKLHLQDFVYQDLVAHKDFGADRAGKLNDPQLAQFFTHDQDFLEVTNLRAQDRITWLRRQPEDEITNAQPWLQLSKLLQSSGDLEGAKIVLYEYHRQQVRASGLVWRAASISYDRLEEDPLWIAPVIATLGLAGSFLFWRAHRIRAMAPTGKDALAEFEKGLPVPAGYPPFNPIVYAFENVLPVVRLGQDASWAPNHRASPGSWLPERPAWLRSFAARWWITRWLFHLDYSRLAFLRWALIVLGWASALILGAAIGGRFKE